MILENIFPQKFSTMWYVKSDGQIFDWRSLLIIMAREPLHQARET